MLKAYILIGAILYSLLGCNGDKTRNSNHQQPLSSDEMATVQSINIAQSDTLDVAKGATLTSGREEKLGQMKKLMAEGKCVPVVQLPEERFDQSWQSVWQVGSSTCPIDLNQHSEFTLATKKWSFIRTVKFKSAEFQTLSGLDQMKVEGSLQPGPIIGGKATVVGKIHYSPFQVAGVGLVQVDIQVTPVDADGGVVNLDLDMGRGKVNARVRWSGSEHSLLVQGYVVDEKTFREMFSSFQLLEIMDRVQKMR